MKFHKSALLLLLNKVYATQWSEVGDSNKQVENGNVRLISEPIFRTLDSHTMSDDEAESDDQEIADERRKFKGENMYDFGPYKKDNKIPNIDDAISDPITLPTAIQFFDKSTNVVRVSSNGMLILGDDQVLDNEPEVLPSDSIDAPFIAGLWNDHSTIKTGKIYWRIEEDRMDTLGDISADIKAAFPELTDFDGADWAFINSYFRVPAFGSTKQKGPGNGWTTNTFQITIATDGKYAFAINNYLHVDWDQAVGVTNKAVAGLDLNDGYFVMMDGSLEDGSRFASTSTNSDVEGRHIFRLDNRVPPTSTPPPEPQTTNEVTTNEVTGPEETTKTVYPVDTVISMNQWPSNNNTLGGGIFKYIPSTPIGNGTCTITVPNDVAYFHIFDAHVRSDTEFTSTVWHICAANPTFEPNGDDGSFNFLIMYERGQEFSEEDVDFNCDEDDTYEFAVYSFPQNHLRVDGRTNARVFGDKWNHEAEYAINFPSGVENFQLDDGRIEISMQSAGNDTYVITHIPESIQEVWFQWDYINYFASNTVTITLVSDEE